MTGIERIGGPAAPATPRRTVQGGSFQLRGQETPSAAPAGPASPVGLAALLALQDEEERPRNRAARRHASDLLAALDALHNALLGAGAGFDGLARLARLLDAMPEDAEHPALRDAVADIRLRARIEHARYAAAPSAAAR